ncbi:mitochondrial potassium channel [Poecilia latipinna]|uniref:Coiled-coil domain containing 51 n=1 Tax=Poecilia latipinna TaxID=48699 RepID=A0A3B3V356_9TELE|nr:PREDICTED: coiled-coil domain-containing protein 51 [Poecilia latipinna]
MRYRGAQIYIWARGSCCLSRHHLAVRTAAVRPYSSEPPSRSSPPAGSSPLVQKGTAEVVKERSLSVLQHAGELGREWSQRSAQAATATVNYWWGRYEEFVGLNEVREAQTKVTEAEAAFMVARGIVREAHTSLEALQGRLKEVRDRLDRVSREEAHYLELATMEHKLLQEERRLRTAYENAESSEREKFGLFSAAVRESHEKERTRAERTKNWSIIGSVLGALIGVMGSTYINRVRLQELKNLLLEAQKGPESLQEALKVQAGNHQTQQDQLGELINSLRVTLADAFTPSNSAPQGKGGPTTASPAVSLSASKDLQVQNQKTESQLASLMAQLGQLQQGVGKVEGELLAVRKVLETEPQTQTRSAGLQRAATRETETVARRLEDTRRTLGEGIRMNTVYNAVFSYTAAAVTISAVYLLLRGTG